jgi:hypothetical protein
MIAAVSLQMLYLIFQQVLGLVLSLGPSASSRDVELLVLRHEVARSPPHQPETTAGLGKPGRSSPP